MHIIFEVYLQFSKELQKNLTNYKALAMSITSYAISIIYGCFQGFRMNIEKV